MWQIVLAGVVFVMMGCTAVGPTTAVASATVVEHEPGDDLFFNVLAGEMSARLGDHEAAFAYYTRAAAQSEHPDIAERGARLAVHSENVKQTIEATRRWVEAEQENIDARRILAALYLRDQQTEQSLEQFRHLLALKQGDRLGGYRLVAEQLFKEPEPERALQVLTRLVEDQQQHPEPWYMKGWYLNRRGDSAAALEAVDRALQMRPQWGQAVVLRVSILESLGRSREVLTYLQHQVDDNPKDADLRERYGRALLKLKREQEALAQFEQALLERPRSPRILAALSLIHLELQQYEKARTYLERLMKLPGESSKANFYLGELEKALQRSGEALAAYASVGHGEYYLRARIEMADLMAEEDVDAGISILHGLSLHDERQKLQVLLIEAGLLERAERFSDAVKAYTQALRISPDSEEVLYSRAMVADLAGDLSMLESDLHTILKINPEHYHAWNALGYTLTLRTDRFEEARGYLERALALRPNDFYVLDSMGWVLYRLNRLEEAERFLQRAFAAKEDAEVAAHLGEVRWQRGNRAGAREIWRKGRQLDPDNAVLDETLKRLRP